MSTSIDLKKLPATIREEATKQIIDKAKSSGLKAEIKDGKLSISGDEKKVKNFIDGLK
jgi:hypothetical protein